MTKPYGIPPIAAASLATILGVTLVPAAQATKHGSSQVSGNAKTACMSAVNANYAGKVDSVKVTHSEFSQANSTVMVSAIGVRGGSRTEHWKCLVSQSGTVEDLSVVSQ